MEFVEDPAKVRERQQARYEQKQALYGARQWHKQPSKEEGGEEKNDDANVQSDRKYKNTNKAKLVHHDRRYLATKKQNRGLLD
jgi:hypothetical protein